MMHYGYGMGWGWTTLLLPLLIGGLVIYGVIKLMQGKGTNPSIGRNDALDILKERFARGEISEEEYERKKKILRD